MSRHLSSKVNYNHRQTGFDAIGDAIASAIAAEDKSLSKPQTQKEMTMKPTASAKPASAAPATTSTPSPGAFGKLLAKITTCLSSITGAELPTIAPVIPQGKSRDSYPPALVAMLPAIPEALLHSLTTDVQRMQADGRANGVIPRIFTKYAELLVVEDEIALSGEQAHLRALISAFGWFLDGWTSAERVELRPEIGGK